MQQKFYPVLHRAWSKGFTLKSDFARANARTVAAAASCGLITTTEPDGSFTDTWRITAAGIRHMNVLAEAAFEGLVPAFMQ